MTFSKIIIKNAANILLSLYLQKPKDMYGVARLTGMTYSYVTKMLMWFEQEGLIKTYVQGRQRFCSLTHKGSDIAGHLVKAKTLMDLT